MSGRPPPTRSEREHVSFDWSQLGHTHRGDVGIRFGFGAGVSLMAAVIGAKFGPLVGGAFLAFPAILPATLTLLEERDSRHSAEHDCRGAAAGAFGLAAFAGVLRLMPHEPAVALPLATLAWLGVAVISYLIWRRVREALGLDGAPAPRRPVSAEPHPEPDRPLTRRIAGRGAG